MDQKNNKLDYLQKYLSKDKKKKKHKKVGKERVKLIDDECDWSKVSENIELDLLAEPDEGPQIAGIVDERPLEVQMKDKFVADKWTLVNELKTNSEKKAKSLIETIKINNQSVKNKDDVNHAKKKTNDKNYSKSPTTKNSYDFDKNLENLPSKLHKSTPGFDNNPKKKKTSKDERKSEESDISIPRTYSREIISTNKRNRSSDSDISPPRKYSKDFNANSRNKIIELDSISPIRKYSKSVDKKYKNEEKQNRRSSDSDISPPRKYLRNKSSKKDKYKSYNSIESDISPPRKRLSPDKKNFINRKRHSTKSSDSDFSPPRKNVEKYESNKILSNIETKNNKPDKQSMNLLVNKRKMFIKDDSDKVQMEEKNKELKEKYMKWGRGLKQQEDYKEKVQNSIKEMSKPLARYADDQDLENMLKAREIDGDPMLEYIKSKSKVKKEIKPTYQGACLPNRFNILPGYRWDGVDRSNGYEKRWFNAQNSKKILEEEAYKWSTEDM